MAGRVVSVRYLPLTIAVPAGTAIAAPTITSPNAEDVTLVSIHLQIPAGHAGLTGIRFTSGGGTIVPWSNPPAWISGDDTTADFEVGVQISKDFKVVTYNIDIWPHTFYGWVKVTDLVAPQPASTRLVPITAA